MPSPCSTEKMEIRQRQSGTVLCKTEKKWNMEEKVEHGDKTEKTQKKTEKMEIRQRKSGIWRWQAY